MGTNTIIGQSVINHNVRVKLGLSVGDYVVLQYYAQLFDEKTPSTDHLGIVRIGVSHIPLMVMTNKLYEESKLILNTDTGIHRPYDDWYTFHKEKASEFDAFYKAEIIEGVKVGWRNPNTEASKKKLTLALKKTPIEQILYAKLRYFIGKMETNSFDYIMAAERFVGPDAHYNTQWGLKAWGEGILKKHIIKNYGAVSEFDLTPMLPRVPEVPVIDPNRVTPDDFFK
jgi:hypothetical protein